MLNNVRTTAANVAVSDFKMRFLRLLRSYLGTKRSSARPAGYSGEKIAVSRPCEEYCSVGLKLVNQLEQRRTPSPGVSSSGLTRVGNELQGKTP